MKRELRRTKKNAMAAGTHSNVLVQWKAYQEFCDKYDRNDWPSSSETLCLFAQHLAKRMRSVKSIENYLYGVVKLHLYAGQQPPSLKEFNVQLTLRGLRRLKRHRVKQAKPITPLLLKKIKQTLDFTKSTNVVLWAAFLTAFFLLLRKSNVVPVSQTTFDPKKQLTRGRIQLSSRSVKVKISWSKTIQFNERKVVYKMNRIPGSVLCPVKAFHEMFQRIPACSSSPCFVLKDGLPLSYNMFQYRLKKALKLAGVKRFARYSAHSFRRGGLQWGYEQGIDKSLLKTMGDWKSSCYQIYLSYPKRVRYQAHKLFAKRLNKF